jgi:hypothetical protein
MTRNNSFIAKQSIFFNLFVAGIFLSIFIGIIFTISGQEKFSTPSYIQFIAFYFVPGIGAIYAAIRHAEVFRIDENGIFYNKKLVTSWDRFIQAYAEEDNPEKGLDVKFSLHIQYYDIDTGIAEVLQFQLSPTLDKSIEEIQEAIESFSSFKIR